MTSDEEEVSIEIKEVLSSLISLAILTNSGPKLASVHGVESLLGGLNGLVGDIEALLIKEFPSLGKHNLECNKKANDKCQNILMKMDEASVTRQSPYGEDLSSGYGLGEESSNELEEGSGDEEEEFDTSSGEEQLHTLSSPSYSAADCEKECDEVDDILGGAASREVNDQGDAVNSIPQHLPPRAAGDTAVVEVGDEDRMNALLLKEDSHLASLHTKLRENGDIIATETQLNEVVLAALERIFGPQQPKYNLLPDLANSFIKAFMCNDNVNKALSLEHKAISLERSDDVIGLSEGMTWGAIAFKVAEMTSENDGSGRADLPEHITSLLEDARTAVSKFDNTNTMKLENFVKFGMNDKIRLGILVSLAMMQVVLSELTIRQLSSDSRASLEWRKSVEELWKLVCPELEFNADVRLSEYFVAVVRPGLNSAVEEIFELSSDVTHDTVKVLTLTKGTKAVREKVRGAYKKSQSRTADGRIDESSVDYCAGDGELHSKARNRMVTIYFLLFVLDVLMRKKLGQEMTRKSLLHKLLITGQDQIRLAFNQSVFNMKQDLRENQLANIRKLLEQKKRRKAMNQECC